MSSPKPLGFYGLKFAPEIESEIDALSHKDAIVLMSITADDLYEEYQDNIEDRDPICSEVLNTCAYLSNIQKISLVKALCDRIEIRLMEVAE